MSDSAPRLPGLDNSLALKLEGYPFISKRARKYHSDLFRGRLLGESTIFMTGTEAVQLFYDTSRFKRAGALPKVVEKTLFGEGGVHGLDDDEHINRKAMFMELMTKANIARFLEIAQDQWFSAARAFQERDAIVLLDESQKVLCRAACLWSGLGMSQEETDELARDCSAMVDGFDTIGPRMWRAHAARRRGERWARDVIERVRQGTLNPPPGTAARVFAEYRDPRGELLSPQIAGVELLNIVRPTTALARWIVFIPVALRDHPKYRAGLRNNEALLDAFTQELRRFYPFVPLLGARSRTDFEWRGVTFRKNQLVVLDIYGTLRDRRTWERPEEFLPERFLNREPTPFDMIPQGGGDFLGGHRCAGEWLSIETLKQAVHWLAVRLDYELPPQDLSYPLNEVIAMPKSGVILTHIRPADLSATMQIDPQPVRGNGLRPTLP